MTEYRFISEERVQEIRNNNGKIKVWEKYKIRSVISGTLVFCEIEDYGNQYEES
jgi:hypothetical protein